MMKLGKLLALITCFSGTMVSAQMIYPSYSDSAIHSAIIETDGMFDMQGSAMRREFSNTLLFGGFIDEGMKGRSFEKHSAGKPIRNQRKCRNSIHQRWRRFYETRFGCLDDQRRLFRIGKSDLRARCFRIVVLRE